MGSPLSTPATYAGLSLWHETTPTDWTPRPPLAGDAEADVAIVGAGYTGLWTAYYLSLADPTLRIAVVEAEVAGFGASGRNGGWCSALFPRRPSVRRRTRRCARLGRRGPVRDASPRGSTPLRQGRHRRARAEQGPVRAGRREVGQPAWGRARTTAVAHRGGRQRLRATRTFGATYTPDCAAIHPARLVRGLADVVGPPRRRASTSGRRSLSIEPGVVRTRRGTVRAPYVVRATEGFTPRLPGLARAVVPVYSLIVATEPLSPEHLGRDRPGGAGDVLRPPAPDHLRPAHRRRPARLRRPRGAVPPRLAGRARRSTATTGLRRAARHAARPVPGAARHPVHPCLGRAARDPARLVRLGRGWTAAPGWPGPVATSATACRPPTWPAGHCAT